MGDFGLIIQKVVSILQMQIKVFGHSLSLLSVFIGVTLLTLVFYAVSRLYR